MAGDFIFDSALGAPRTGGGVLWCF